VVWMAAEGMAAERMEEGALEEVERAEVD